MTSETRSEEHPERQDIRCAAVKRKRRTSDPDRRAARTRFEAFRILERDHDLQELRKFLGQPTAAIRVFGRRADVLRPDDPQHEFVLTPPGREDNPRARWPIWVDVARVRGSKSIALTTDDAFEQHLLSCLSDFTTLARVDSHGPAASVVLWDWGDTWLVARANAILHRPVARPERALDPAKAEADRMLLEYARERLRGTGFECAPPQPLPDRAARLAGDVELRLQQLLFDSLKFTQLFCKLHR